MIEAEYQSRPFNDIFNRLKRRKTSLLLPASIIMPLALMLAFCMPATYQSQATILLEEQNIPQNLSGTTLNNFAVQQIQVIGHRILTVENISNTAEKFDLYERGGSDSPFPSTDLASEFRDNVKFELLSADVDVIDPPGGRPTQASITFILAFIDQDPAVAQEVAGELVSLLFDENLHVRVDEAASTKEFPVAEADRLNSELLEQGEKRRRYTLIEPPARPYEAIGPNRPAIVFWGFGLAACIGVVLAILREAIDKGIHGANELAAIMGEAPLVTVEYIDNDDDIIQQRRARVFGLVAAVAAGLLFFYVLYLFCKPLKIFSS